MARITSQLFQGWVNKHGALAVKAATACSRSGRSPHKSQAGRVRMRRTAPRIARSWPQARSSVELGLNALNQGDIRHVDYAARDATHQHLQVDEGHHLRADDLASVRRHHERLASRRAPSPSSWAEKPDVTITYQPALIRIDGDGKLVFKMDEISEYLGREMTAEIFEVNTSTHYGRMVVSTTTP